MKSKGKSSKHKRFRDNRFILIPEIDWVMLWTKTTI
jgi:hypothetical protein